MAQSSLDDEVRTRRETVAAQSDKPITTYSRRARDRQGSVYACLPPLALEKLGINAGEDVAVDVHHDHVVIRPGGDDA